MVLGICNEWIYYDERKGINVELLPGNTGESTKIHHVRMRCDIFAGCLQIINGKTNVRKVAKDEKAIIAFLKNNYSQASVACSGKTNA